MATITATPGLGSRTTEGAAIRAADLLRWSLDHKVIGLQYMASSLFFFIVGGTMAMLIRWELLTPALDLMADGTQYNALMTIHGSVMIFLWIIPMMAGFGNYLVPLMLGAKDMAFPWLNAFAFWLIPPAGVLMIGGWLVGPPEAGWTAYPPLSTLFSPDGQTMWAMALHLLGVSSILGAINFVVTIRNMRPAGMTIWKMPLFVWAVLATAIIQVLATPFLTGGLTLLILDRTAGTSFLDPGSGGDVLLWQNG
ncbi:MAG: cbb3-type cytochrome c oxidase subunit I, partial [Anaerolineaceae bacterium]|nr:cbb3-type cytochrome c oxidase subunit I [Anaerolineaceae bacterium]